MLVIIIQLAHGTCVGGKRSSCFVSIGYVLEHDCDLDVACREVCLNLAIVSMFDEKITRSVIWPRCLHGNFHSQDFVSICQRAKLRAGIKPTVLCSALDKENSIGFPLDFLHYLYNYYMVCALFSHAYHVTHHVTLCDVML